MTPTPPAPTTPTPAAPVVHLVGAGPGDPMLLTRRAARLLAQADVVVLDRRSLDPIAAIAPPTAERVFVGRADGHPAWDTEAIADLLAERAGNSVEPHPPTVVRLKSGDPFVCSRGGEEVAALLARGIRVEVTPGVSAATAAPLAAGMVRGRTVTFLAGNDDPAYPDTDLAALADPTGSLVVLVGRSRHAAIAGVLVAADLDPATPAAVVHGATRPDARVIHTTVEALGDHRLPPPATVVIGPHRAHP